MGNFTFVITIVQCELGAVHTVIAKANPIFFFDLLSSLSSYIETNKTQLFTTSLLQPFSVALIFKLHLHGTCPVVDPELGTATFPHSFKEYRTDLEEQTWTLLPVL